MCLAVPGRILSVAGDDPLTRIARADFAGVVREIRLAFVPEAEVGAHVIAHAGFATTVIGEAEALRLLAHLREIGEAGGERR